MSTQRIRDMIINKSSAEQIPYLQDMLDKSQDPLVSMQIGKVLQEKQNQQNQQNLVPEPTPQSIIQLDLLIIGGKLTEARQLANRISNMEYVRFSLATKVKFKDLLTALKEKEQPTNSVSQKPKRKSVSSEVVDLNQLEILIIQQDYRQASKLVDTIKGYTLTQEHHQKFKTQIIKLQQNESKTNQYRGDIKQLKRDVALLEKQKELIYQAYLKLRSENESLQTQINNAGNISSTQTPVNSNSAGIDQKLVAVILAHVYQQNPALVLTHKRIKRLLEDHIKSTQGDPTELKFIAHAILADLISCVSEYKKRAQNI